MSEPRLIVVADAEAAAAQAARLTADTLAEATEHRGRADWAVTGGSSPAGVFRRLIESPLHDVVPWPRVHVWWGDDRYVPRDHRLSNVKAFDDILLGGRARVPIPVEQVHPWPTGEAIGQSRGPTWCVGTLAAELRADGPPFVDGWPAFDLLMLGVGGDGHILSVFPGSATIGAPDLAMAIPAPGHIEPHVGRVTLNPAVVGAAKRVLVLATGVAKSRIVEEIFGPERDPTRWPAQLALGANATWILDEACAARLSR